MPDFALESVHTFWYEYDKKILYRIITSMEGIEHWVSDTDPSVDEAFNLLGQALENPAPFEIDNEALVINILANTRSSRALRLMQHLDGINPGTASKLLVYAEEQKDKPEPNAAANLFLKRNLAFERLQLLGRIFAPERINLVLKALEKGEA